VAGESEAMLGVRITAAAIRQVKRMDAAAAAARRRAKQLGRPVLVSVTTRINLRDPLAVFARGSAMTEHRFYWSVPSQRFELTGLGEAWAFSAADGRDRWARAAAAWQQLLQEAVIDSEAGAALAGPLVAGGFSFDPTRPADGLWQDYPAALLTLPRLLIARRGDQISLTVNGMVDAGQSSAALGIAAARRLQLLLTGPWLRRKHPGELQVDPSLAPAAWQGLVARAVTEMQNGSFAKVVLARAVRVRAPRQIDSAAALDRLRQDYPDTFVFALARGGTTFVGASPERLVSLQDGRIRATALAGSAPRGADAAADARLADGLLNSAKDRAEHALVVEMIRRALAEFGGSVTAPDAPTVLRVRNVQHLFTPLEAPLADGRSVFDLLARLHPTPAVGGQPREAALAWIRANEQLDRGWYAAPLGWIDSAGNAEFCVALRSALVGRRTATLFAGCGIIAASDPARELQETRLKLRAMLGALGAADETDGRRATEEERDE
jgi:isochorismate synthase